MPLTYRNRPAAVALHTCRKSRAKPLLEDSAELFAVLLAKPQDELVRLLAVLSVHGGCSNATRHGAPTRRGAGAGRGLGMAAWWQPTANEALPARFEGRDSGCRGRLRPRTSPGWRS